MKKKLFKYSWVLTTPVILATISCGINKVDQENKEVEETVEVLDETISHPEERLEDDAEQHDIYLENPKGTDKKMSDDEDATFYESLASDRDVLYDTTRIYNTGSGEDGWNLFSLSYQQRMLMLGSEGDFPRDSWIEGIVRDIKRYRSEHPYEGLTDVSLFDQTIPSNIDSLVDHLRNLAHAMHELRSRRYWRLLAGYDEFSPEDEIDGYYLYDMDLISTNYLTPGEETLYQQILLYEKVGDSDLDDESRRRLTLYAQQLHERLESYGIPEYDLPEVPFD